MENDNLIRNKSFEFALDIISLYKQIIEQKEFVLSKQLLRSGTSVGANVEEAIGAHSKKDFISKMIIAYKEARETRYWLMLFEKSNLVQIDLTYYLRKLDEIINILTAIIKTSKANLENKS